MKSTMTLITAGILCIFHAHSEDTRDQVIEKCKDETILIRKSSLLKSLPMKNPRLDLVVRMDISDNQIADLDTLPQFRFLRWLDASRNRIVSIDHLKHPTLQWCNLEENPLKHVPNDIRTQVPNIILYIHGTPAQQDGKHPPKTRTENRWLQLKPAAK